MPKTNPMTWPERLLLPLLLLGVYLAPLRPDPLPVFAGQFNTVDGSLYISRGLDVLLSLILVWLVLRHLLPNRFDPVSLLRAGLVFVAVALVFSGLEWMFDRLLMFMFNLPTGPDEISDKLLFYPRHRELQTSILSGNLAVMMTALLYGLSRDRIRQLRQQESEEKERLAMELRYLKSQINPQFLFNTLNYIYCITQRNAEEESGQAILQLSDLLRYMLYDSEQDRVSLATELKHIDAYVELLRLRYSETDPLEITIQVEDDLAGKRIAPLLLLPLVENAFKHGISATGEGQIEIRAEYREQTFHFLVANKLQKPADPEAKGLGLENLRRRLELLYPGRHGLKVDVQETIFRAQLRIEGLE